MSQALTLARPYARAAFPIARDAGALVPEQELCVAPAHVLLPDQLVGGDAHVGEEDLVHLMTAVDELDRPH